MTYFINLMRRTFLLYKTHVAVLLPLLLITSTCLVIDKIPYINLYKDIYTIVVLTIDWLVLLWLSRISTAAMVKVSFVVFLATIPLYYLQSYWYIEVLANFSYVIFATAIFFELTRRDSETPAKKKKNEQP